MGNFKVKVNTLDESKEIQNILESIGFRKFEAWSELGSIGGFIWTDSDMTYCDNRVEYFDESPRKEITLPELLDMVNDQYAEIEQVRQHRHYFIDVSDVDEIDFYQIALRYNVTDPCVQHILKKCLAVGQRGQKDFHHDLKDIYDTAKRMLDVHGLDS